MLSPKRTKYRKAFKGRIRGAAKGGFNLDFGAFGLKAMEPDRLTARQIEAARRAITRHMKRAGRVWIRVFPDVPVSKKPAEVRMGSGKGAPEFWAARVKPGRVLFELDGVSVQVAQVHLFFFLGAVAAGTFMGGPLGERFGRKYVIWFSILGMLPFTLILPYANLFWTGVLSVFIGVIMASAFPAIVVYAQELLPGKVGMIAGLFYGFSFGMAGIGAAVLGALADATSITTVYKVCAFLPLLGLLTVFLPNFKTKK